VTGLDVQDAFKFTDAERNELKEALHKDFMTKVKHEVSQEMYRNINSTVSRMVKEIHEGAIETAVKEEFTKKYQDKIEYNDKMKRLNSREKK
jgi:uncharacterized membrane protein YheB (UPF0754 family)